MNVYVFSYIILCLYCALSCIVILPWVGLQSKIRGRENTKGRRFEFEERRNRLTVPVIYICALPQKGKGMSQPARSVHFLHLCKWGKRNLGEISTYWTSLCRTAGSSYPVVLEMTKYLWFQTELFRTSSFRSCSTYSSSSSHSLNSWRQNKRGGGHFKRGSTLKETASIISWGSSSRQKG